MKEHAVKEGEERSVNGKARKEQQKIKEKCQRRKKGQTTLALCNIQ